jgi:hypothetical protein
MTRAKSASQGFMTSIVCKVRASPITVRNESVRLAPLGAVAVNRSGGPPNAAQGATSITPLASDSANSRVPQKPQAGWLARSGRLTVFTFFAAPV